MAEPARRGRPPTFDQAAALDTATDLFWRHGYEGTSIAMLTEAMGVTPPTLYAAFGSKEELYRRSLARYRERERAAPDDDKGPVYGQVEYYLRRAAREFPAGQTPAGCMVAVGSLQCSTEEGSIAAAAAGIRAEELREYVARLDAAKDRGELPARTNTEALARFYAAVVQGMAVQAIDGADAAQLDALVDVALAAWPGLT